MKGGEEIKSDLLVPDYGVNKSIFEAFAFPRKIEL